MKNFFKALTAITLIAALLLSSCRSSSSFNDVSATESSDIKNTEPGGKPEKFIYDHFDDNTVKYTRYLKDRFIIYVDANGDKKDVTLDDFSKDDFVKVGKCESITRDGVRYRRYILYLADESKERLFELIKEVGELDFVIGAHPCQGYISLDATIEEVYPNDPYVQTEQK